MSSNFLTVRDVADRFGVKETTVYRWAKEGTIPSIKVGRTIRFNPEEVSSILREQAPDTVDGVRMEAVFAELVNLIADEVTRRLRAG